MVSAIYLHEMIRDESLRNDRKRDGSGWVESSILNGHWSLSKTLHSEQNGWSKRPCKGVTKYSSEGHKNRPRGKVDFAAPAKEEWNQLAL